MLFETRKFVSASGFPLTWKIECDRLTAGDWAWAADRIRELVTFKQVIGVPTGGLTLQALLKPWEQQDGVILYVDDVYTTGGTLVRLMKTNGHWLYGEDAPKADVCACVLFSRFNGLPPWVDALWTFTGRHS